MRESNLQIEGPGRSVDTSHGLHPPPKKELGLPSAYPHKPAPTTPRAHTAGCHSRCRPPRAVGHHHRAQRTRRSVPGCTRGGGSWATSPAEAGGGVGRVFLPTYRCAIAACARLDLGERADGNTSHAPRAAVPRLAGCTARGVPASSECAWRSRCEGSEACTPTPPRWPPMQELLVPEERKSETR
jgi:hypothetical protein